MKRKASQPIARLVFATFSAVLIASAYLRGNYLLGFGCGVTYVAISLGLLWLFARSITFGEKQSLLRATIVAILSLPVGFAMAYPALINPDVQHFIDKQSTARSVQSELAAVFVSDLAYADLSCSTVQVKVVNVTIHGSLNDRSDFGRLRNRIAEECDAVNQCLLHWDVTLRKPTQRIDGLDSELFDAGE